MNHGRWVADCPFCGGAEQEWAEGLRTHEKVPYPFGLVRDELHCGYTGQTCVVVFPKERAGIEHAMAKRPDERTRNWLFHETLTDLEVENTAHGLV